MTIKEYVMDALTKYTNKIKKYFVPITGTTDDNPITGNVQFAAGKKIYGTLDDGTRFSWIAPGNSNSYIGTTGTSYPAHPGKLLVASGAGNDSIYVSVTKDDNSGQDHYAKVLTSDFLKDFTKNLRIDASAAKTIAAQKAGTGITGTGTIPDGYVVAGIYGFAVNGADSGFINDMRFAQSGQELTVTWSVFNASPTTSISAKPLVYVKLIRNTF